MSDYALEADGWEDEEAAMEDIRRAVEEADAEAAAQRAAEWAAFEQDMQTAYPWPEGEIDPFTPRQAA